MKVNRVPISRIGEKSHRETRDPSRRNSLLSNLNISSRLQWQYFESTALKNTGNLNILDMFWWKEREKKKVLEISDNYSSSLFRLIVRYIKPRFSQTCCSRQSCLYIHRNPVKFWFEQSFSKARSTPIINKNLIRKMHKTIDSSGLLIMFCICILRLVRWNLNVYHGTIKWEAYVKF